MSIDFTRATGATGVNANEVQGAGAAASPLTGNPILVGGSDGTNTQTVSTDTVGVLQVFGKPSGALYEGTGTATTTAAPLAASLAVTQVIVQNSNGSSPNLLVGNATGQPFELTPGQALTLQVNNVGLVFVKAASGTATYNWLARS